MCYEGLREATMNTNDLIEAQASEQASNGYRSASGSGTPATSSSSASSSSSSNMQASNHYHQIDNLKRQQQQQQHQHSPASHHFKNDDCFRGFTYAQSVNIPAPPTNGHLKQQAHLSDNNCGPSSSSRTQIKLTTNSSASKFYPGNNQIYSSNLDPNDRCLDKLSEMREKLFRILSKVPIQVDPVHSSNNKVIDREPLVIKYYNERSLNDILELHFKASLIKYNHDNGIRHIGPAVSVLPQEAHLAAPSMIREPGFVVHNSVHNYYPEQFVDWTAFASSPSMDNCLSQPPPQQQQPQPQQSDSGSLVNWPITNQQLELNPYNIYANTHNKQPGAGKLTSAFQRRPSAVTAKVPAEKCNSIHHRQLQCSPATKRSLKRATSNSNKHALRWSNGAGCNSVTIEPVEVKQSLQQQQHSLQHQQPHLVYSNEIAFDHPVEFDANKFPTPPIAYHLDEYSIARDLSAQSSGATNYASATNQLADEHFDLEAQHYCYSPYLAHQQQQQHQQHHNVAATPQAPASSSSSSLLLAFNQNHMNESQQQQSALNNLAFGDNQTEHNGQAGEPIDGGHYYQQTNYQQLPGGPAMDGAWQDVCPSSRGPSQAQMIEHQNHALQQQQQLANSEINYHTTSAATTKQGNFYLAQPTGGAYMMIYPTPPGDGSSLAATTAAAPSILTND